MSERPDESGKEPSHRLRFGAGLLVGTILVAAVGHRLLTTSLGETARFGEDRRAVISLRALTDVVARAGSGEAVRTVVAEFAKVQPQVAATRVVLFDGISLEASTDPADTGENAAPRRLKREEKDLYDRGQRLRASIETNRQEGGGRKDEVEKERLPDGSVSLAAPIERDGEVVGLVEKRRVPPPPAPRPSLLTTLSYVVAPVVLFALLALVIGERRVPLGILAALLLAGTAWGYGAQSWAKLSRARTALEADVAGQVKTSAARAQELLGTLAATAAPLAEAPAPETAPEAAPAAPLAPLDPASWDSDAFRRPLGLSDGAGHVDEAKVAAALGSGEGDREADDPPPRGARARPPRVRRPRRPRRAPRDAEDPPRRLLLRPAGDGRDDPPRLLPLRLRHRPLVHGPDDLQLQRAPHRDLGRLQELRLDPHGLQGRPDGRRRRPRLQLPELLLDALGHGRLDGHERDVRRRGRADPGAHPEHEGPRAEAGLPRPPDPPLGHAELHHGPHLAGDVPPAVRRREPGRPDVRDGARSRGSRRRPRRSSRRGRRTGGSASRS